MPKVGDKEFAYTPEGVAAAKRESEVTGIPMSDGANRSVTEYAGGGKVGYDSIGRLSEAVNEESTSRKDRVKKAKKMKKHIEESAKQMGLPTNVDMNILFANMNNMVSMMRQQIDKQSAT